MKDISVDAEKKTMGRIASQVAVLLQGKTTPDFRTHKAGGCRVIVENTDKMAFSGKKLSQKKYYRHTGYIGHLKTESAQSLFVRDSSEMLRRAVRGMLPKNRLLKARMKNLIVFKAKNPK